MNEILSHSLEETMEFGKKFASSLSKFSIVCFYGHLGAGKTTLIKSIIEERTGIPQKEIASPTFVFMNMYEGKETIYHFDLYRLPNLDAFLDMGFDQYLESKGICCIEWAEKISPLLPSNTIHIKMMHQGDNTRLIQVQKGDLNE